MCLDALASISVLNWDTREGRLHTRDRAKLCHLATSTISDQSQCFRKRRLSPGFQLCDDIVIYHGVSLILFVANGERSSKIGDALASDSTRVSNHRMTMLLAELGNRHQMRCWASGDLAADCFRHIEFTSSDERSQEVRIG